MGVSGIVLLNYKFVFHRIGCSHELNQIKLLKSANVIYEWPQWEADESVLSAETSSSSGKGTSLPIFRLVPSGNFFLPLNRNHHFLLKKKGSKFNKAT